MPKQFIEIGGLPILMHTLRRFQDYSSEIQLILVLPEDQVEIWGELTNKYDFGAEARVVNGGTTRFESVRNGLHDLPDEGYVAIHDGVRPFISPKIIEKSFQSAIAFGSGVVAQGLTDSIRQISGDANRAVPRADFRLMQTPQTFRLDWIKLAYDKAESNAFTDDASVFEAAGFEVHLVEGNPENFKITTQVDLIRAKAIAEVR